MSPEHSLWFHVQVTLAAPPEFSFHTVTFTELVGILSRSAHAIEHRVSSALCTSISACGAVFSARTSACSCSATFYPLPVNTAPPPCPAPLCVHPAATCCCTPHPCYLLLHTPPLLLAAAHPTPACLPPPAPPTTTGVAQPQGA